MTFRNSFSRKAAVVGLLVCGAGCTGVHFPVRPNMSFKDGLREGITVEYPDAKGPKKVTEIQRNGEFVMDMFASSLGLLAGGFILRESKEERKRRGSKSPGKKNEGE